MSGNVADSKASAYRRETQGRSHLQDSCGAFFVTRPVWSGLAVVLFFMVMSLLAPVLRPYDASRDRNLRLRLSPPSWTMTAEERAELSDDADMEISRWTLPFGTDENGRDLLGARLARRAHQPPYRYRCRSNFFGDRRAARAPHGVHAGPNRPYHRLADGYSAGVSRNTPGDCHRRDARTEPDERAYRHQHHADSNLCADHACGGYGVA